MKTPTEIAMTIVLDNLVNDYCVKLSMTTALIRKAGRVPDTADIHELSAATTRVIRELEKIDDLRLKMRELAIFGYADVLENLEKKGAA